LFSEVLPARAASLNQELKWLAAVLGTVRDLDVQLERMDEMDQIAASWEQRSSGAPLAEVRDLLERHREGEREHLIEALDSPRWDRLATALTAMVTRGPARTPAARQPAALVVPALVDERHHKVVRASRRARRTGEPADFHRLRIRAKRLRYSLEFTSDLYGPRTDRFTKRLARLQDRLGLLQDAEVATSRLFELALSEDEPLSRETVFAMGGVAEWYRADAANLLTELPGALKVVKGKEWQALDQLMERRRAAAAEAAPAPRTPRETPSSAEDPIALPPVSVGDETARTPSPDTPSLEPPGVGPLPTPLAPVVPIAARTAAAADDTGPSRTSSFGGLSSIGATNGASAHPSMVHDDVEDQVTDGDSDGGRDSDEQRSDGDVDPDPTGPPTGATPSAL
jgi:CHAD domain-containing protein